MKTPKEYTKALKENRITPEIISDVLFSYSKRAKNYRDKIAEYRDKARMYRYCFAMFDNVEAYTEKKNYIERNLIYYFLICHIANVFMYKRKQ